MDTYYGNHQQLFTAVWNVAAKMEKPAMDDVGRCAYRTEDGRKCLIGALIPDKLYSPVFEHHVASEKLIMKAANIGGSIDSRFVDRLQMCHDEAASKSPCYPIYPFFWQEKMMDELRSLAKEYGLKVPE